jgi:N-hydroxyarylamine O-acetyltransferase
MNIDTYLQRINYDGSREPTAETLRQLQVAHLLAVPFENLSIHSGEPIVLEDEALFQKIVVRKRGGFCYEANGLFAALLHALGFKVSMLAAGVANAAGEFGPPFDHMALMVELDQRWLVDVGFGESFLQPLLLDERGEQVQGNVMFRIDRYDDDTLLLLRDYGEGWKPQYRFTLQSYIYPDYAEMCRYHQTSPDSHFTKARICSRATENGRITLSDMRLIATTGIGSSAVKEEKTLADESEYAAALRDHFGIVMKL